MGYWVLTKEQRKFLTDYQYVAPFKFINRTIEKILDNGQYDDNDRTKLNNQIEWWKSEFRTK